MSFSFKAATFTVLFISLLSSSSATEQPTVAAYFSRLEMYVPQLSPSGEIVAYIATGKDRKYYLNTYDIESKKHQSYLGEEDHEIYQFSWINDNWVVFDVLNKNCYHEGSYGFNIKDPSQTAILQIGGRSQLVDSSPNDKNRFWMSTSYRSSWNKGGKRTDQLSKFDITKKSAKKGSMVTKFPTLGKVVEKVTPPMGKIAYKWMTCNHADLIIALLFDTETSELSYHRYNSKINHWAKISVDPDKIKFHAVLNQNTAIISQFGANNHKCVYQWDLEKNEKGELLFEDPHNDIDPQLIFATTPNGRELLGCQYKGEDLKSIWLNGKLLSIQRGINQAFPGKNNTITSFSNNFDRAIVQSVSPTSPPEYYLFDSHSGKITLLSKTFRGLEKTKAAPVYRFNFTSKDGIKLEALLTKPSENPTPLVVFIHGGPHTRDHWTFDRRVQFLANRGYSVLQVNYRGSTGFGQQVSEDEAYHFLSMMDDIKDAIDKVVSQGFVDPENIALMGASFGAYSSVSLASQYPEMFKCIIATAGIYDFEKQIREAKKSTYKGKRYSKEFSHLTEHIGTIKENLPYIRSISPINSAGNIICPTLIVHGTRDSVVSYRQSKDLIKVLKNNKVPLDYYFEYKEGHGFTKEENNINYWEKVESFLHEHMPTSPQS